MLIEKNIPAPTSRIKWPFELMSVGDSFQIPEGESKSCRNAACAYQSRNEGVKFTIRNGRCWRVS